VKHKGDNLIWMSCDVHLNSSLSPGTPEGAHFHLFVITSLRPKTHSHTPLTHNDRRCVLCLHLFASHSFITCLQDYNLFYSRHLLTTVCCPVVQVLSL